MQWMHHSGSTSSGTLHSLQEAATAAAREYAAQDSRSMQWMHHSSNGTLDSLHEATGHASTGTAIIAASVCRKSCSVEHSIVSRKWWLEGSKQTQQHHDTQHCLAAQTHRYLNE
jgi:hypothetical protein